MEAALIKYCSHLNIPISGNYLKKCILSHPDYPSLLSLADTLERLGIDHQVGQIEQDQLNEAPFPYMLQLDRRGAELLLIKDQKDLADHQDELEHWKGVVIKLEPTDAITDDEHNEQLAQEKLHRTLAVILVIALLGLLALPLFLGGGWFPALLLATSLGGAAVGYLLLAKDLGITYKPVESFCNAGKRTNCDRILNAEEATLFGAFTFSDAAASYFGWQLIITGLFIPLFAGGASYVAVLAGAATLSIPVIGYSLYYQYAKANTWCRLCVIIDGILAAQMAGFAAMYANGVFAWTDIALVPTAIALSLFAAVAASIILLKERLKTANASTRAETAAKRVKYDPEVFMHVLSQQEQVDMTPFSPEITIGDPAAPVQILMVANLHCNPCRIAFETMTQLTTAYPQKVGFSIRLTQGMNNTIADLSASTYLIRYWLHHIYGQQDEGTRTQTFIGDWYARMNPQTFAEQYPANGALSSGDNGTELLEDRHYRWVKENEIAATPTFFVNGYKMPRSYRIQDLMPMLPGLAALLNEQKPKLDHKNLLKSKKA